MVVWPVTEAPPESTERDLAKAEAEQACAEAAKAELCADASVAATQALSDGGTAADYEAAAASAETAASACS